jgi:hypothetical protein
MTTIIPPQECIQTASDDPIGRDRLATQQLIEPLVLGAIAQERPGLGAIGARVSVK